MNADTPAIALVSPQRPEDGGKGLFEVLVLGCKVNQYEAEQIRQRLESKGMRAAGEGEVAEVIVVHTCAVTSMAVKKSRQAVRRLQRCHSGARVVVTGCAASGDLLAGVDGITARVDPGEDWLAAFDEAVGGDGASREGGSSDPCGGDAILRAGYAGQARAFLKVQDGCDIGCAFCIVPRLRRAPRDKPLASIREEACVLAEAGHREVVLSGVSVGLYGRDTGGPVLADVLQAVADIPGLDRIRLSSLHPAELTDDLLGVWRSAPNVMPHVHLPLQAGSDRVLAAMRRRYTASEFLGAVGRVRAALDDPAINTDVIVGFPAETEEDFRETIRVSREAGFSRMHIFTYSRRPHTRAARMEGVVGPAAARERAARLEGEAAALASASTAREAGRTTRVLVESRDPAGRQYRGYTERYTPVRFGGPPGLGGTIVEVRVAAGGTDTVPARLVAAPARDGNRRPEI